MTAYHFSGKCPNIYNPYSLLNAPYNKKFDKYWFSTDTPTSLSEIFLKENYSISKLENIISSSQHFDVPLEQICDPIPALYQSGYLTIKDYQYGMYKLGIPNEEVRQEPQQSLPMTVVEWKFKKVKSQTKSLQRLLSEEKQRLRNRQTIKKAPEVLIPPGPFLLDFIKLTCSDHDC